MQVRIDDDVIPLLEASKAAHGGSLSKAANRLLRASAGKPRVVVSTMSTGTGSALSEHIDPVRIAAAAPTRIPQAAVNPKRVGRCSHPLLRRIGDQCALCGSTV